MTDGIYIMKTNRFYKVGVSGNPEKRRRDLQIGNPYPVEIVKYYEFSYRWVYKFEEILHELLAPFNARGEWFELTDDELEAVKSLLEHPHAIMFAEGLMHHELWKLADDGSKYLELPGGRKIVTKPDRKGATE